MYQLRKTNTFFSRFERTRGEKTQIFRTTVCTKTFVNEPSKKGPTVYQVSFESFAMRDCATCYVKIDIDGDKTTYCEDNYPNSVMQITQDTFELEGLMMDKGGFQLLDLIITELKSHMTWYNSMPLIG